jgi:hypothetical protein
MELFVLQVVVDTVVEHQVLVILNPMQVVVVDLEVVKQEVAVHWQMFQHLAVL